MLEGWLVYQSVAGKVTINIPVRFGAHTRYKKVTNKKICCGKMSNILRVEYSQRRILQLAEVKEDKAILRCINAKLKGGKLDIIMGTFLATHAHAIAHTCTHSKHTDTRTVYPCALSRHEPRESE
jgi:hypothetical protein